MHDDLKNLHLTFPKLPLGKNETPHDLRRLLYKGGAALRAKKVDDATERGELGDVKPERVELVCKIHEFIAGELAGGGSGVTARRQIDYIRFMFAWADKTGVSLSLATALQTYLLYGEHLWQCVRVEKNLKPISAYNCVRACGRILDAVLERSAPMVQLSRIKRPKSGQRPQGAAADKQNLQETFAFGGLLQAICDATPLTVIRNEMPPLRIPLQGGGEVVFAGLRTPSKPSERPASHVRKSAMGRLAYLADRSLDHRTRSALVNLRIMAELMTFLAQTGKNLSQALVLPLFRVSYQSDTDGYKVLDYKKRAGGEVMFNIYSEYRPHFDRYLEWRRSLFTESEQRLFPLIRRKGVLETNRPSFGCLEALCKQASVTLVVPRMLRKTRVNWCLRRSGDPKRAAEMAQHTVEVLRENYEVPSLQRTMIEVTIFWSRNDPNLAGKGPLQSVAPGECSGAPEAFPDKPRSASEPDCIAPSGCLFCIDHRDIDTFDYVWSLACFRHLKSIELSKQALSNTPQAMHPAEHAIQKASAKLTWFREFNAERRDWVEEALVRVEESDYHNQWSYLIEAMERPSK